MTSTNPAIAGSILKNFSIIVVTALTGVAVTDQAIKFASRKYMAEGVRGQLGVYNASVQVQQDPLDTIFDRTRLMNAAKAKKPWNMTLAEKERAAREQAASD